MKLYGGIDLHSNNSYLVLIDDEGTVIVRSRMGNEIGRVLQTLQPYRGPIDSLALAGRWIESCRLLSEAGQPECHGGLPGAQVQ